MTSQTPSTAQWTNWSGNVSFRPAAIESPRSVEHLQELVSTTTGKLRPVGSGHSFTALATTQGTVVALDGMEGNVLSVDSSNSQATLNAGASLNELSKALHSHGLGFKNLGDIDVQSLAGATSTATHGTGATLPCLSAELTGMTILQADGTLLSIDARQNSELLPAAQVALGCLGIVVDATVSLRPSYKLHRRTFVQPLEETLAGALRLWEQHRNYEFFYLPFCDYAFNITHDETTAPDAREGSSDDEAALRDLRRLRTGLKRAAPLRRGILNQVAKRAATESVIGTSFDLLASERTSRFNEMEYHLPVDTGLDALAEVISLVETNPEMYFPVECRRTAGDEAWLSPFQGGDRISIAVHVGEGDDYRWLFDVIEPVLQRHGGRPHWGKLHSLKAADLKQLYPDFERFTQVRKQLDPTGRFLNHHTAALWGEVN